MGFCVRTSDTSEPLCDVSNCPKWQHLPHCLSSAILTFGLARAACSSVSVYRKSCDGSTLHPMLLQTCESKSQECVSDRLLNHMLGRWLWGTWTLLGSSSGNRHSRFQGFGRGAPAALHMYMAVPRNRGLWRSPPSVRNLCRRPSATNPCRGRLCRVL